jgi:hypothetical protein
LFRGPHTNLVPGSFKRVYRVFKHIGGDVRQVLRRKPVEEPAGLRSSVALAFLTLPQAAFTLIARTLDCSSVHVLIVPNESIREIRSKTHRCKVRQLVTPPTSDTTNSFSGTTSSREIFSKKGLSRGSAYLPSFLSHELPTRTQEARYTGARFAPGPGPGRGVCRSRRVRTPEKYKS